MKSFVKKVVALLLREYMLLEEAYRIRTYRVRILCYR